MRGMSGRCELASCVDKHTLGSIKSTKVVDSSCSVTRSWIGKGKVTCSIAAVPNLRLRKGKEEELQIARDVHKESRMKARVLRAECRACASICVGHNLVEAKGPDQLPFVALPCTRPSKAQPQILAQALTDNQTATRRSSMREEGKCNRLHSIETQIQGCCLVFWTTTYCYPP